MKHLGILVTVWFLLLGGLCGQQRFAVVRLADGRTMQGMVVSMSLQQLQLQVGDRLETFPAVEIRSCQFHEAGEAVPTTASLADDEGAGPGSADEVAAPESTEPSPAPAGETRTLEPREANPVRLATIPDYVVPGSPESLPADVRHQPLWRLRLQALDETYPWLAPAAPTQWFSLGLLLLVGLGLSVHLSVQVVGAESARLRQSVALGAWYAVTGVAQVALVPIQDLSVALMLLGNSSVALFALHAVFGLTRWWAVVALTVQLGCAVIAYGVLELVHAVLGSVGAIS